MKRASGIRKLGLLAIGVTLAGISLAPNANADGGTYYASYPTYDECHDAAVAGRRAGEWYRYFCREVPDHWDLWVK
ncbi:hypothetical protein LVJ94_28595 [Pendulispora rubella]|uniref:Chitin-binding type-3 domain-containing protein n=1 Tax=Pendulispora rubella TaxID=2741070 RepID=A0ABZ2KT28_9BACT